MDLQRGDWLRKPVPGTLIAEGEMSMLSVSIWVMLGDVVIGLVFESCPVKALKEDSDQF